ncbi:uncharacterized protein LOC114304280 [Camellia sinensis]|uniref:uncharacterized protein LOC114304280 n=1 Tax=Camellia sinensis TaxID=4442 RepID=UPI001035765C|nr:uncharacterized protein LOC114304280 [Camellia sinensis]
MDSMDEGMRHKREVAEGLNILIERAKELGLIRGVKIGSSKVVLTHLQFADNTIFFCEVDRVEVMNVKRIHRCFEVMSGLKINFHKSSICGMGATEDLMADFASKLNCKSIKLPFTYLGLPLGASPSTISTWKPIIDKCRLKLASWKGSYCRMGEE